MGPPAKKKRGSDKLDSSPGQEINAGEKSWEEKRNFNIKAKMAAVEKLTPKHPDWLWLQSPSETTTLQDSESSSVFTLAPLQRSPPLILRPTFWRSLVSLSSLRLREITTSSTKS